MDLSRTSTIMVYDVKERCWSNDFCEAIGIPRDKLPDCKLSETLIGKITNQSAEVTGLIEGILVCAGAMDTVVAAIGIGKTNPIRSS